MNTRSYDTPGTVRTVVVGKVLATWIDKNLLMIPSIYRKFYGPILFDVYVEMVQILEQHTLQLADVTSHANHFYRCVCVLCVLRAELLGLGSERLRRVHPR